MKLNILSLYQSEPKILLIIFHAIIVNQKVRNLLTKEEIYSLIDEMPEAETQWYEDKNTRKNIFNSVLRSDDYHQIISMMHTLYIQQENQRLKGKKLLAADERMMQDAEHLIHQEFAFCFRH